MAWWLYFCKCNQHTTKYLTTGKLQLEIKKLSVPKNPIFIDSKCSYAYAKKKFAQGA